MDPGNLGMDQERLRNSIPTFPAGSRAGNSQIPAPNSRAGFPWDVLSGASSSSSSASGAPLLPKKSNLLGLGMDFWEFLLDLGGEFIRKKEENSGLIQIFGSFSPIVWELFLSLGTGGGKVSFMSISLGKFT